MARKITSVLLIFLLAACGAKKRAAQTESRHVMVEASTVNDPETDTSEKGLDNHLADAASITTIDEIVNTALGFSGVRYKYGGTTKKGMDCSGLLYVAFKAHDIALPRVSYEMAREGRRIRVNDVSKGDLLFFKTSRRGKRINHVGLVVAVKGDDIKFIHSTSSRGVIVSSLHEGFWNYSFVMAARML